MTEHKAFFNTKLALAFSVIGKKEIKKIIRQHTVLKSNENIKKEDEVYLKKEQIKRKYIPSPEKETYKDIRIDIIKNEYIVIVKEEYSSQDNKYN